MKTNGEERIVAATFEIFKDSQGEYRWRLKSANRQVIATGGEGYASRAGATNGSGRKRDAPETAVVDAD